ncbi:MAG: FHA domain-containing protein [Gammaproteobacteria bacterium]
MSILAIELNDAGILAASANLVGDAAPGCARFNNSTIETGTAALQSARLFPHEIEYAYWHRLSLDPMTRTTETAHTHADLAYAQLAQIYAPYKNTVDRVVISVPSSFSSNQLGLLLGICQRAEIPVTGLADASVAAVSHPVPGQRMLHVDATNHCVLITELVVNKGLHRADVTRIDNVGLLDFASRWATKLGDLFVKQTRFDPLHSAQAEQHLYNQIPAASAAWLLGEETVAISSEDGQHTANIEISDLSAAVAGLYQPIVNAIHGLTGSGGVTTVLLSHRLAQLPGLESLVADHAGVRVVTLDEHVVTRALLQNVEHYESAPGQFALAKSKPWQETPSVVPQTAAVSTEAPSRDLATHVLIDHSIYRLSDEPFVMGTSPTSKNSYQVTGVVKGVSRQHCSLTRRSGQVVLEDMSTFGTKVNGKPAASSQPLKVGDCVSLGNPGIEVRLVREADTGG